MSDATLNPAYRIEFPIDDPVGPGLRLGLRLSFEVEMTETGFAVVSEPILGSADVWPFSPSFAGLTGLKRRAGPPPAEARRPALVQLIAQRVTNLFRL